MPFVAGCGGGRSRPDPGRAVHGRLVPAERAEHDAADGDEAVPRRARLLDDVHGRLRQRRIREGQVRHGEEDLPDAVHRIVGADLRGKSTTRARPHDQRHVPQRDRLPTAEQNRCAFVLDNGATSDGAYSVTINRADPPMLFVGMGVVRRDSGATIAFPGLELFPGSRSARCRRSFDFYPFIGFTDTETDFTKVARLQRSRRASAADGHVVPDGGAAGLAAGCRELDADAQRGRLMHDHAGSDYSCRTTGTPWTLRKNTDGTSDNVFVSRPPPSQPYPSAGQGQPLVIVTPSQAQGVMIVGKLNGQLVPVVIRVGYANVDAGNPLASVADAEIGISVLAPAAAVAANSLQGGYIGATSAVACGVVSFGGSSNAPASSGSAFDNTAPHPELPGTYRGGFFYPSAGNCTDGSAVSTLAANYTSTLFQGATAAFLDPMTSAVSAQFSLDYTQTAPGKIKVTATRDFNAQGSAGTVAVFKKGDYGWLIKVGNVYGMVVNNSQYNPFFTVGAFVQ
nr:DUF2957 domain-containing protein [Burkholderia pseudomallei]